MTTSGQLGVLLFILSQVVEWRRRESHRIEFSSKADLLRGDGYVPTLLPLRPSCALRHQANTVEARSATI
jgi:hypothetical protein